MYMKASSGIKKENYFKNGNGPTRQMYLNSDYNPLTQTLSLQESSKRVPHSFQSKHILKILDWKDRG